jgi:hypothetical protein
MTFTSVVSQLMKLRHTSVEAKGLVHLTTVFLNSRYMWFTVKNKHESITTGRYSTFSYRLVIKKYHFMYSHNTQRKL